jgi:predicted nuclease of restriction endonuclease-like (RecB) superfamily
METRLYERVRHIIDSARAGAARSVDTAHVISNWLIGREIVQDEQKGERRAAYGLRVLEALSGRLTSEYGRGYSIQNLQHCRRFFLNFPELLCNQSIPHPLGGELTIPISKPIAAISQPVVGKLSVQSWRPGLLSTRLGWRHYRTLLRIDSRAKRDFYEIEAVKNAWNGRELERQINSLLYERLALSKDKPGVMRLAVKGQEIEKPADAFKDPMVIEFLGLPESHQLVESTLEGALIANLRAFLMELGKGFAFVARQERLTLDGDHFYVDLVFYHTVLKCYALVDLKVGKLTHQDMGQMQLYVNYFDRERRTEGDGPTIGVILCTDKNDAVVRYTLGEGAGNIFASRYKLHLPSEDELRAEVRREVRSFGRGKRQT